MTTWSRRKRILITSALAAASTLVVIVAVALISMRPLHVKAMIEKKLSDKLGLDVTVQSLTVSLLPRPRMTASNMVFRVPSQADLPAFLAIDEAWVDVGLFSALRGHVGTVHLEGMKINVPPGDSRKELTAQTGGADSQSGSSKVVVDHLEAHDAVLTILRSEPGKDPLVFKIRDLNVDGVGFDREMTFTTALTNPVPEGLVTSSGALGPWVKSDPTLLPVSGDYKFSGADLNTIKGIGGILTSTGHYKGRIIAIEVEGRSETPDFNLDLGGKPVPLSATFKALVDGSNGTTRLDAVEAKLFNTSLSVTGIVENLPGPGNHSIKLDVAVTDGRIEDILALAIAAPKPLLTGDVSLKSSVLLPPGPGPTRDRLKLSGRFGLSRAHFSDGEVQGKLQELSRRSQGKDQTETVTRVMTRLGGGFRLASGVLTLSDVTFAVPGATVAMDGTYGLTSAALDFTGVLRMQTTVSNAVGGVKSIFLKPFDWLFKRDGAGAVIPIKITGTRDHPKMGIRIGKALTRSD